ncbi:MAG: response regulator transcription factor [Deltaproteobacteria bacterium]|nr:response regulator transcription factor [Deltaproteobacteria bacterium]
MSIRVVLADDHAVLRVGLRALLEREADLHVVGEAGSGSELLTLLARSPADVVVLDLSMPGMSGAQAAEAVLKAHPQVRILILTMHEDPYYLQELFRVGVRGYLLKKSGADELVRAIRAVYRGDYHVDAALGGLAVSELVTPAVRPTGGRLDALTPRERDVCRMLALGHTNAEVGDKLQISERTVESHRTHIMHKLELRTRAELVRFALDHGLLG